MGKIFYIMGKSASGKDRIYSLLAAHKELNLKTLILYTTRPIRAGEQDGKNYYFVDDGKLEEFRKNGNLIEERAYHTVYGIWTYFTADDGQVNLADSDYLGIGTLESFKKMRKYYGEDAVCPVYVQVEDGERLSRAPVSYTHLRAHETKANLVCRLLLEKKKPSTNNNHD